MQKPTYCKAVLVMEETNVHRIYHDNHYGFPIDDDNELFGRFVLEINQAGLSWDTILKKQENFKKAYKNFQIKEVANFQQKDLLRSFSTFSRLIHNFSNADCTTSFESSSCLRFFMINL